MLKLGRTRSLSSIRVLVSDLNTRPAAVAEIEDYAINTLGIPNPCVRNSERYIPLLLITITQFNVLSDGGMPVLEDAGLIALKASLT